MISDERERVVAWLRDVIHKTPDDKLKLRLQAELDRLTGGFRAPGGCGDKVLISVQRKGS